MTSSKIELRRLNEYTWEIPKTGGMRVPGIIYADDRLMEHIRTEKSPEQVANVAHLPGIVGRSMAMPDIHWGYGFPIGGVAATDPADGGVVSPGGVGYDINCGVRLVTSRISEADARKRIDALVDRLFEDVPAGVGSSGAIGKLGRGDLERVVVEGSGWAVAKGYGSESDLERTEENGRMTGADPGALSDRAIKRGLDQVGTLGSGNHFLELGVVDEVYDERTGEHFGLAKGDVTVMVHSGSRGLGYQVCDDSLEVMQRAVSNYGIELPDRQLACAPVESPEGRRYLAAMACAANYAWANRQVMMALAMRAVASVLDSTPEDLGMRLLYDVCHNIAKLESHAVDGRERRLCVHRKGATRAFPPGHEGVPADFRDVGQPVLIPGDMGRHSFVCAGTEEAYRETFGSTCHGAGRVLSRSKARKSEGRNLKEELRKMGIAVRATGKGTLAEEMPRAYKDVADVVGVVEKAGLARKVARLRPIGVVKG